METLGIDRNERASADTRPSLDVVPGLGAGLQMIISAPAPSRGHNETSEECVESVGMTPCKRNNKIQYRGTGFGYCQTVPRGQNFEPSNVDRINWNDAPTKLWGAYLDRRREQEGLDGQAGALPSAQWRKYSSKQAVEIKTWLESQGFIATVPGNRGTGNYRVIYSKIEVSQGPRWSGIWTQLTFEFRYERGAPFVSGGKFFPVVVRKELRATTKSVVVKPAAKLTRSVVIKRRPRATKTT
jgi:hypothetical protein